MIKIVKQKAFTLVELLIVIAIIGLLSSIVLFSVSTARIKARDAKRAGDIQQIYTALVSYNVDYGCLPVTFGTSCPGATGYSEQNSGGWDYSSQGGFLTFLQTSGYMAKVPVDPINNMTGDASPAGSFSYRYYCYPSGSTSGLRLDYWRESDGSLINKNILNSGGWTDSSFLCK